MREATAEGFDVIGYPRLVRLDPNVPTKTRGNASLAVEFGHGRGPAVIVGRVPGRTVPSYARAEPLATGERERLLELAWRVTLATARWEGDRTEPALAWSVRELNPTLYRSAVTRWTEVELARRALRSAGGGGRWARSSQGLVGAASALGWPAIRSTFELIAYRTPAAVGSPRRVDAASVRRVQARYPELFLCHDPRTRRVLVAPHSSCPVLYGLRAVRPDRLPRAAAELETEPTDRWMIFETNQGTGDHLVNRTLGDLQAFDAARVEVFVRGEPEPLPGGHVRLRVGGSSGPEFDAYVFEPSKTLPPVATSLRAGDRVALWAGVGRDLVLRVEGLELLHLVPRAVRGTRPVCSRCRRAARTMGTNRGFRCPSCRRRWPPEASLGRRVPPTYGLGVYHPTPSARRHLAPLAPEPRVRPTS